MGLALTYAQSITQILNFLIRVTAELEVNVSIKFNCDSSRDYYQLVAVERLTEYGQLESEAKWRGKGGDQKPATKWMQKVNFICRHCIGVINDREYKKPSEERFMSEQSRCKQRAHN